MHSAKTTFIEGITSTKSLFAIYDHLLTEIHLPPEDISDLLRSQIVYAISALDRLIHELVRIGILEIFNNKRKETEKFKNHPFKAQTILSVIKSLKSSTIPSSPDELPEAIINKEIIEKLSFLAFQAPEKIKDALSYIWNEPNKMVILANRMRLAGSTENDRQRFLIQTLQLIVNRRNQIVHEADFDCGAGIRRSITRKEVEDNIDFIQALGISIYEEVTAPICYIKK